jgi:hypothetical protein
MDVSESSQPAGLKCFNCGEALEAGTGGIDQDGYAYCEKHLFYQRGYSDGLADKTRELLTVFKGEEG